MSGKSKDEPKPEMVDLGGDELHRSVQWEYPEGTPELIVASLKARYLPPFWPIIEELARDCDEVLAREGFPKAAELVASGADGQWRYEEQHLEPFTDCWYAAEIGNLCWHVSQDKTATHELQLRRIMEIGALQRDWKWRTRYKPTIVRKREHDAKNRGNAPDGGVSTAVRAERARAVLRELALHPDTVRRWIGLGSKEQRRFLCRLAEKHDNKGSVDDWLFTKKTGKDKGKLNSEDWFSNCLSDWRVNGDIDRALKK